MVIQYPLGYHVGASPSTFTRPPRTLLLERKLPSDAPRSIQGFCSRIRLIYGHDSRADIRALDVSEEAPLVRHCPAYEVAEHFENWKNHNNKHGWVVPNMTTTRIYPQASDWIPDWWKDDNLLYDIHAQIAPDGLNGEVEDRTAFFHMADGKVDQALHMSPLGLQTFIHVLAGEILIFFNINDIDEPSTLSVLASKLQWRDSNSGGHLVFKAPSDGPSAIVSNNICYKLLCPGDYLQLQSGILWGMLRRPSKGPTLYFAGHSISKENLSLWIEKASFQLKHHRATDDVPSLDLLKYVDEILKIADRKVEENGYVDHAEADDMDSFVERAHDMLKNSAEWLKADHPQFIVDNFKLYREWKEAANALLEKHRVLFEEWLD